FVHRTNPHEVFRWIGNCGTLRPQNSDGKQNKDEAECTHGNSCQTWPIIVPRRHETSGSNSFFHNRFVPPSPSPQSRFNPGHMEPRDLPNHVQPLRLMPP